MGQNSIARANVLITTDANGLDAGLKKASQDVDKFAAKTSKSGSAKGKGGIGGEGGAFANIPKGAAIAAAAIATVGAVAMKTVESLDELKKQGDMANALGLTSEQFTGMAGVAKSVGEDSKEFVESLVTMGKLGRDAANGTQEASAAMQLMGINVQEFNKLRTDEQFFKIFDSLGKMGDAGARTGAIMKAFGEDGGKWLLPLLSKSPEKIREMAKSFEISTESMKKATAAAEATGRVKLAGTKMWQSFVIGAAPAVEAVADFAGKTIAFIQPVIDWFGRAWERGFTIYSAIFDEMGKIATWVWDGIKDGVSQAEAMIGIKIPSIQDVVTFHFRIMGVAAALVWDTFKAGAGVAVLAAGTFLEILGLIIQQFKKIVDLGLLIPREFRPDGFNAFVDGVHDFGVEVDAAGKKLSDWGKGAITSWGDSAKKFDAWLDKVIKKKDAIVAPATAIKVDDIKSDPVKLGGAILKGTTGAYSAIVKNQFGVTDAGKNSKAQLDQQKAINKNTAETTDFMGTLVREFQSLKTV